jgi:Flp pilus assembly protein TadD
LIGPIWADAAHNNLAAAFVKKGQIENAIIEIESTLQVESGNATYHYNYAIHLSHTGDTEKARKHLKITLSINPENEGARQALHSIKER